MPFASFHRMNLRTNPSKKNFKKNENWRSWKMSFFLGGHFEFFFFEKKIFFRFFITKKTMRFISGKFFFTTMDGFLRILGNNLYELFCTRLQFDDISISNLRYEFTNIHPSKVIIQKSRKQLLLMKNNLDSGQLYQPFGQHLHFILTASSLDWQIRSVNFNEFKQFYNLKFKLQVDFARGD